MFFLAQKALQLIECSKPGDITACFFSFTCFPSLSWPLLEAGYGTKCCLVGPTIAMFLCLLSLCHILETLLLRCLEQLQVLGAEGGYTFPAAFCFSHCKSSLKGWLLTRPPLVDTAQLWILIFEVLNFHFVCTTRSSAWTCPVLGTFQSQKTWLVESFSLSERF